MLQLAVAQIGAPTPTMLVFMERKAGVV